MQYEAVTTYPATVIKVNFPVLMILALPTTHVPDVLNHLVETIPDTERTWIAGLNGRADRLHPASWNQTERAGTGLHRTDNYCESFNSRWTCSSVIQRGEDQLVQTCSAATEEEASTEGRIN